MMKGKISFIQMMTKKLFRIRMKPRPGEERVEQSVVQSERDRVTKTTSLPSCGHSLYTAPTPLKPFKKRKYHSQKVKSPGFDEFQLENVNNSKPKKKLTRRKLSLRNVRSIGGRLNESCPDLKSDLYFNFNYGVDGVDAVDGNTLQLFRDISVVDVEFIEINFE